MKLKEINRTAILSWSPAQHHPVYIATGTSAQQLDASFSTNASLELFEFNLSDPSLEMKSCGTFTSSHRYHKLAWSPFGIDGQGLPSGVLIAGGENGNVILYDPVKILSGDGDVIIAQSDIHVGPVRALDVNPFQTNLVASGGNESEIYIWDINNFGSPMTPGPKTQPPEDISCVAWNRQVQHILASSSQSGRTSVWDLRKNDLIIKVCDHSNRMHCSGMVWNPEVATQLVMASEDDRMPVIQMWDLRFASSPLKIFENHSRGVLAIAWSTADPELLLSCGKDSRILCWNPNTAEIVYELPSGNEWCFDIQWCPRNPAVLSTAGFNSCINIYSIMGGTSQAQSHRQVNQINTSFGNMDSFGTGQTLPPLELPQSGTISTTVNPLIKPPKWLRRPVGASFAFGGKLVYVENEKHVVHVSQVVTETDLLKHSSQLQDTISSGQFVEFCQVKINLSENEFEKKVWSFLKANFDSDTRSRFLELLGYNKEELALKISAALSEKPAAVKQMAEHPPVCDAQPVADHNIIAVTDNPEATFILTAGADMQPSVTPVIALQTLSGETLEGNEEEKRTLFIEHNFEIINYNQAVNGSPELQREDEKIVLEEEVNYILDASEDVLETPVEETSADPSAEAPGQEPSQDLKTEEPSVDRMTEEPSLDLMTEEPSLDLMTEEPSLDLMTEEPSLDLMTEEPSLDLMTEEPSLDLMTEEPSLDPLAKEPSQDLMCKEPPLGPISVEPSLDLLAEVSLKDTFAEEPPLVPLDEELSQDLLIEEPSQVPLAEEHSQDLLAEEPSLGLLAEEPSLDLLAEEPSLDPLAEEPSLVPLAEEPSLVPLAEEPSLVPLAEEPSLVPLAEEPSLDPFTEVQPLSERSAQDLFADLLQAPSVETSQDPFDKLFQAHSEQLVVEDLAAPEDFPPQGNLCQDVDGLIAQAVLTGDFEGAVELCLHDNRMAESIILAIAGGTELLEKTQKKYFIKSQSKLTKLISAVVMKDLYDILSTCELQNWKEALAAVMTYAQTQDFSSLCDLLGGRLEEANDSKLQAQAFLCYICAGNLEKLVSCWIKAQDGKDPFSLQDLVEKVVVMRHAVEQNKHQNKGPLEVGDLLAMKMSEYANLLASQGCLSTAITYIPDEPKHACLQILRERLSHALGQPDAASIKPQIAPSVAQPLQTPITTQSSNPYSVVQPSISAPAQMHYYQPVRAASTVTSWSNRTPTAFPHVPTPLPSGSTSDPSKMEPPNPVCAMPSTGTAAVPSATPFMHSHQYQTYAHINQGAVGMALYQPHQSSPSVEPVLAEPCPPRHPPGFLSHHSQAVPPQTTYAPSPLSDQHSFYTNPSNPPFIPKISPSAPCTAAPSSMALQQGGPGSPGPYMWLPSQSGVSGPQNGWNDPPTLSRGPKKMLVRENYAPPAPITTPIMAPLGVDPQSEQVPPGPPQIVGLMPHAAQTLFSGMQQPLTHSATNSTLPKRSCEGAPGAPVSDVIQSVPAEKITKKPIPDEHLVVKTAFEGLIQKCLIVATDPQTKRKLDDANKRLEILYDKLREQTLSPAIVGGLHHIARTIESRSYTEGLKIHTHIVSSSNFSEISGFMPVLKVVLTQANKLGV